MDLMKISGVKEFQEETNLFIEQIKLLHNELFSILRVQSDINMESVISMTQNEMRRSNAAIVMMSYQNSTTDDHS